ncbi:hypothetical protein [Saccharothrix sp. HUAS TT1]|uniref:hypothetical protein n=1 Tax=unclassified Saccharothrix TaxID=2593673 RepID=UPI00345B6351
MRRKLIGLLAVAAAAVAALGVVPGPAAHAVPVPGINRTFLVDEVNIRSGPWLDRPSHGLGYRGHQVYVRCKALGQTIEGDFRWFGLTDNTTGVSGYSWHRYVDLGWEFNLPDC